MPSANTAILLRPRSWDETVWFMRRPIPALLLLLFASLLVPAPVALAEPTVREQIDGGLLEITPGFGCEDSEWGFDCETDMKMWLGYKVYTNDITLTTVTLTSLDGATVPKLGYEWFEEDDNSVEVSTDGVPLPAGRYQLKLHVSTPGKWECSEYWEDVCKYFRGEKVTMLWRFAFDGQTAQKVRRYYPPITKVNGRVKVKRKRKRVRVATGKVTGRVAIDDLKTRPMAPIAGRRVFLDRRIGKRWKQVRSVKTKKNGRFKMQVRVKRGSKSRWRIRVAAASGSPGWSGVTKRI